MEFQKHLRSCRFSLFAKYSNQDQFSEVNQILSSKKSKIKLSFSEMLLSVDTSDFLRVYIPATMTQMVLKKILTTYSQLSFISLPKFNNSVDTEFIMKNAKKKLEMKFKPFEFPKPLVDFSKVIKTRDLISADDIEGHETNRSIGKIIEILESTESKKSRFVQIKKKPKSTTFKGKLTFPDFKMNATGSEQSARTLVAAKPTVLFRRRQENDKEQPKTPVYSIKQFWKKSDGASANTIRSVIKRGFAGEGKKKISDLKFARK